MRKINAIYRANIHDLAGHLTANGSHFFERETLRFFGDSVANWSAHWIGGRLFIRNIGHRPGDARGFPNCTLRGQVREVTTDADGLPHISQALERFHGMRPLQILRELEAETAAGVQCCATCRHPLPAEPRVSGAGFVACDYCGASWRPDGSPAPELACLQPERGATA